MNTGHWFRRTRAAALLPEDLELIAEIDRTRHTMESARNHFEQVVDPTLIDCYIYELNAAQLRYQFLLRRFKLLEELRFTQTY
ncbi:MAG: YaaL family protein [Lachnospiraceae bacterium]|nr:YaaL family protein [Lachnospiraceae bacterium]